MAVPVTSRLCCLTCCVDVCTYRHPRVRVESILSGAVACCGSDVTPVGVLCVEQCCAWCLCPVELLRYINMHCMQNPCIAPVAHMHCDSSKVCKGGRMAGSVLHVGQPQFLRYPVMAQPIHVAGCFETCLSMPRTEQQLTCRCTQHMQQVLQQWQQVALSCVPVCCAVPAGAGVA